MKDTVREKLQNFVDKVEDVEEKLDNMPLSSKTGAKIGVMLGLNPITGPILGGAAVVAGTVYGAAKITKKILEKEDWYKISLL